MGLFVLLRVHIVMSWFTCMQQTQQKVYQLVLIYKKGGNGSWMDTTQMKGAICKNFSLNHWKCTKMTNRKWRLANCSYSRAFSVPCLFVAWIRRGRGGAILTYCTVTNTLHSDPTSDQVCCMLMTFLIFFPLTKSHATFKQRNKSGRLGFWNLLQEYWLYDNQYVIVYCLTLRLDNKGQRNAE